MICEYCKNEHNGSYGSGRFCSDKCARSFSRNKDKNETKIVNCIDCGTEVKTYKRSDPKKIKCNECVHLTKIKKKKIEKLKNICSFCNQINCDCHKWKQNIILFEKIGVFEKGKKLKELNKKTLAILFELYFNKGYSKLDLKREYNLRENTIYDFFKKNNIKLRTLSESTKLAYLNGKLKPITNYPYKHGWHTTWEGKQVYYRSSTELKYAKFLDMKKVPYEMEIKKFLYYDTQKKEYKISIPDFYLPLENKLVEIKGEYFYDEQNIKDRKKVYLEQGYNFELILDIDLDKHIT